MDLGFWDEADEFNLEKDFRKKVKTAEELQRLTVDENLSEIDRAVYILSSGQELQYYSVLKNLPNLFKSYRALCTSKVLPIVKDILDKSVSVELHTVASEAFADVGKDKDIKDKEFSTNFLKVILTHIKGRDAVAGIWIDSFVDVIPHISSDVIRKELLPIATVMGQLSKPTPSRLHSCKLFGAIANKFTNFQIKQELVPKMKLLCQDVEQDVRTCMCSYLHHFATALGAADTKSIVLDEIIELASDEEYQVRISAFNAFLEVHPLLDEESLRVMKPMVKAYCEQAILYEDSSLLDVAKNYGPLCNSILGELSVEERGGMLKQYHHMCLLGRPSIKKEVDVMEAVRIALDGMAREQQPSTPILAHITPHHSSAILSPHAHELKKADLTDCRRHCAYNLPGMFELFYEEVGSEFTMMLVDCSLILLSDTDVQTRINVAVGLHEIARILGSQSFELKLHLEVILRQSESCKLLDQTLPHLGETLVAVCNNPQVQSHGLNDILVSLLTTLQRFSKIWSYEWRCMRDFVIQLKHLPQIFPSDHVFNKFVSPLFNLLHTNSYLPVRQSVCYTLCHILRYNRRPEQRREILDNFVQDLCRSKSYRDRLLFIDLCHHLIQTFSHRYFKHNIFIHTMALFDDKVANVRLCFCQLLPSIKSMLKLPADRSLHSQLEQGVRKFLSSETDKDVSKEIRRTIFELDRLNRPATATSGGLKTEAEIEDKRKEEEEDYLLTKDDKSDDRSKGNSFSAMTFQSKARKSRKKLGTSSSSRLGNDRRGLSGGGPNRTSSFSGFSGSQSSSTSSYSSSSQNSDRKLASRKSVTRKSSAPTSGGSSSAADNNNKPASRGKHT